MPASTRIPVSTYRLQFSSTFRFRDAAALIDYLDNLGITDVYASPALKARRGSNHGYDVTDPTRLNPELGTEEDFHTLSLALKQRGMGLLLDIVPNHMAASPENPWWQDYQEKGKDSAYAAFFDTNWLDFEGSGKGGYRRFFDIDGLAGIRVEDPQVFAATHALIFRLVREGAVTGLRLDHIDGLYDPLEYLRRLQLKISGSGDGLFYVLVEKILSGDEELPGAWPVCGTTGYEFTRALSSLFVYGEGLESLGDTYQNAAGRKEPFAEVVYGKKKLVMAGLFPEESAALGRWLAHLSPDLEADEAGNAIIEVTACLPVYRTYIREAPVAPGDRRYIEGAVKEAAARDSCSEAALRFLKRVLLLEFPENISGEAKKAWLEFVRRWQQLTGAVMAKGFEDTALYNYNRLISLNEVGGEPETGGVSCKDFHNWNMQRAGRRPHTMNATSTHDSKRSEDVRARINVLSEVPGEWAERLAFWTRQNRLKKTLVKGLPVPEPDTEIMLYQTMLGAWPLHRDEVKDFQARLKNYMLKAAREAKVFTSWRKTDTEYEGSLLYFIDVILEETAENRFLEDFLEFQEKISFYGMLNSLSQLLLKITSPGVPDFYRGTELWDLSMVDPDNRRPVDFSKRMALLEAITQGGPSISEMLESWRDGRIKLYLTWKALHTRRDNRQLFQNGEYLPLRVTGVKRENVCAFARRYQGDHAMVVVPRFFTGLSKAGTLPSGGLLWQDTRIILPQGATRRWRNVFTGKESETSDGGLPLSLLTAEFPAALLIPFS